MGEEQFEVNRTDAGEGSAVLTCVHVYVHFHISIQMNRYVNISVKFEK